MNPKIKILRMPFFALVVIAMFAVPVFMICKGEKIFSQGNVYLFKAAPVDPYDYFRGRYVNVRLEKNYVTVSPDKKLDFSSNEAVYATIKKDKFGLAYFDSLSREIPKDGDYVQVNFTHQELNKAYLLVPFNQFYMNEELAPEAERVVREALLKRNDSCLLKLRVHDGTAVIENILINNIPIKEYIQSLQKR